jgi:hypothetical protein
MPVRQPTPRQQQMEALMAGTFGLHKDAAQASFGVDSMPASAGREASEHFTPRIGQ